MYIQSTLSKPHAGTRRRKPPKGRTAPMANRRIGAKNRKKKTAGLSIASITPWKVILASFLLGACGILYITHVFSTQQSLREVRLLETEYTRIQRIYSERRLRYDRLTGPKEIYQSAREEGFVNAGPADRVLIIEP